MNKSEPIQKAKNYFLGINCQKLNCYQSVLAAFQDGISITDEDINNGFKLSGGRAPNGLCGAIYAVLTIFEKKQMPEVNFSNFTKNFEQASGSLKCREIRALNKMACVECVEAAARIILKSY